MAPDAAAYHSGQEHLHDELRVAELLVRAQVERWRAAVGEQRDDTAWGTGILDPREVERYLSHDFTEPMAEPDVPAAAHVLVGRAYATHTSIRERCERTDDGVLPLTRLQTSFGLERTDITVLMICLLGELDGRYRRLFAYLADERWLRSPSVSLLAEIVRPGPSGLAGFRARFAPDAPLVAHRLITLSEPSSNGDAGLASRSITVDDRIVGFLLGENHLEGWLTDAVQLAEPLLWDRLVLGDAQLAELQSLARACAAGDSPSATLALLGAEGSGRTAVARCVATQVGVPLMVVDAGRAAAHGDGLHRDVYREAVLREAAVMWRGCEVLVGREAEHDRWWAELLIAAARHPKPTFVDHAQPWDPPVRMPHGGPFLRVPCPSPGLAEREAIWSRLLRDADWSPDPEDGVDVGAVARQLAGTFLLTPGRMHDALTMAGELARSRTGDDGRPTRLDLDDACRRQSSRRLLQVARRVEPPAGMTLDDIVLPAETLSQLRALRDRIAHRPRVEQLLGPGRAGPKGLVAMFSGSSGTGKTLAAGLLAQDLGRDLLKVDLSQVVSKWVGETEKNLDRVLRDVQEAHALLFFDEAEAIFGARGTVTNAQDRYALQETSFLLQRIEEHEGVVILATNLRQNLDAAFTRRIQQVIEFPTPDDAARLRIWRMALSSVAHDLDDDDLVRLSTGSRLSAAAIVQVVLAATYAAVARDPEEPAVTVADVDRAIRAELQRVGLPSPPVPRS
ncbi:ATP-binding protein [Nocardioides sp. STR2]|uniref:ATP-binding protein n=1 Tax=Nocardioides pini TaxID=2975053 RepID=A0ABT4CAD0_9ACTN|nr:ATP-binding protein [Nocardioides pini]MCY4725933.1 ATP-binding protein [Nocardioides pini]